MEWKFIVKRELSVLFYEFIATGQTHKAMHDLLGLDFGYDHYRAIDGEVCYSAEEIDKTNVSVRKSYAKDGPRFFVSLLEKWDSFIEELETVALKISKTDYANKTTQELIAEFERLHSAYYKLSTALYAPIVIETLAEEILKKEIQQHEPAKIDEYYTILTASEKENEGTKELHSMLWMAIKQKQGKDVSSDIKRHIKNFGWINTRGFIGDSWTEKEILERLNGLAKEDAEDRLHKLENGLKLTKQETERVLKYIKADDELRKFVAVTKELVHFRTHRMDVYVKSGFLARPLFEEIAQRINMGLDDLFYLISSEIKDALEGGSNKIEEIKQRKKAYGLILYKDDITLLTGKELDEYKKKNLKEEIKEEINELSGTTACGGVVKGTVKVLAGKQEIGKVEKGDILVASMTTPDFVPAMERAAAFVTDEGGILCHAAIVSREMNKPCVIGTNIATKVLKDGDVVEVNADDAVVKIIKRKG